MFKFFVLLTSWVFAKSPQLFIDDVNTLMAIEKQGYSLIEQMGAPSVDLVKDSNLQNLYQKNSSYKFVADTLINDLNEMKAKDKSSGPEIKYAHRLFNGEWLRSSKSRFELAGIVFRPERIFRHPQHCGEIRLIYRLAYNDEKIATYSRLPMTLQQVRLLKAPCDKTFQSWSFETESILSLLKNSTAFDFEVNLQSVRWPAAIKPDMGAYAEYIMRAFENQHGQWQTRALDNTIDVDKISKDPKLKKELLDQLKNPTSIELADQGELNLNEKFLTHKGVSVAVHGLNRTANRVFSQIISEKDFKDLDYSKTQFVKSPKGYLKKLDEMTCVGCHQSKSIAGFHFLGQDRAETLAFNSVKVPFSVHFWGDQHRRAEFMDQIVQKNKNVRSQLGFADRSSAATGVKNDRCYVGSDITFTQWTCQPDLKCEPVGAIVGNEFFGICQEKLIARAGDACFFGRVKQNKNSQREAEVSPVSKSCGDDLGCLKPSDGYPGGLCFANFCKNSETKACAALAVPGFNPCLARGRPFKECLAKFTGSIEAGECSLSQPCRDDFICAEGFAGKGVCAPPYSLFQLRVDGHSKP